MKKILALLLALVMALGCAGAFAEDTQPNEVTFELPAFTVSFESTTDVDAFANLLPMFGVDESTVGMMQTILPLLADNNGQIVFADNGIQIDLGLKGQTVLTVAGEKVEGGYALASDILPSYVITLADETIEAIFEQFSTQVGDAFANVDFEAVLGNVTGYAMEFISTCVSAVSYGEAELGEFAFEDLELTFNCRMPVIIDMEAIKGALVNLIAQIKSDEAIGGVINALSSLGLPIDLSEQTEIVIPDVTVYAYSNVDEQGNSVDGATMVDVDVAAEGGDVCVRVVVDADGVAVYISVPSQETYASISIESDDEGFVVSIVAESQGMQFGEIFSVVMGDAIAIHAESYFMDMDNPVQTETLVFSWGGERTFPVLDENKAAIGVEQLMADTEGQYTNALLADLMSNGLGNLIAKISQIMPEEMAEVMNLLYPAETVVAE